MNETRTGESKYILGRYTSALSRYGISDAMVVFIFVMIWETLISQFAISAKYIE